ncbi:MAG: 2-C-methyl-D-erythritol 4-phosphate cytidylyltransferase [bacterium]
MKTIALVAAAGVGIRLGDGCPKPYRCIGQHPMISYTLRAMDNCPEIDRVVVIASCEERQLCEREIVPACCLHKPYQVIVGGEERQQSVFQGLLAVRGEAQIVVIHDAARPFVSWQLVQQSIHEAKKYGSAIAGIPVRDTLKRVNAEGLVAETVPRTGLFLAQTPQAFQFDLLWAAHQQALEDGFQGTDDSVLVERIGIAVRMIQGSLMNIKITYPEDLELAEKWLAGG